MIEAYAYDPYTRNGDQDIMARVQLVIPDEDRDRFVHQARREGMTLSGWLRTAAHDRLDRRQRSAAFESPEELDAFFLECDELPGPESEPDWDEHLNVLSDTHPGLGARDLCHLASCRRRGVNQIKTFDQALHAAAGNR